MAPTCKGAELWIIRLQRVVFSLAAIWISTIPVPVVFAQEFPEFTHQPESRIISKNSSVTLTCSAIPADVHIRWLYNGKPLDERRHHGLTVAGSNLVFERIDSTEAFEGGGGGGGRTGNDVTKHPGNAGVYRCTATNDVGTIISVPAMLSVPVVEDFPPRSTHVNLRVPPDGYVTLTCDTPHSLPAAKVIFIKDDGSMVDTQRADIHVLPSGNVVLNRLTSAHSGSYRCVVVNPTSGQNRTSPSVTTVLVDPAAVKGHAPYTHVQVMDRVRQVQVAVGNDVILECPSYGQRSDSIVWSKYGGSLPSGRWQKTTFGNLRIYQAQSQDSGTYKCAIPLQTHPASSSSLSSSAAIEEARIFLEVIEAPAIQVTSRPSALEEGRKVEMKCRVLKGHPMPTLTWFHNGREVSQHTPGRGDDGTFVLHDASRADSGIYQCLATNQLGTASGTLELMVMGHGKQDGDTDTIVEETPLEEEDIDYEDEEDEKDMKDKTSRRDRKKVGRRKKMRLRERRKKKKGEKEKPKYAPSVPTVTQLSDRTAMLNWTVPDRDNGQTIKFFKIQFKEMSPKKGSWQTSDAHLSTDARRFEVGNLRPGGSYKFRILAVYEDDDNKNSDNTPLFKLNVQEHQKPREPDTKPTIVEAQPVFYQDKYGIGIKWQYKTETAFPIEGFVLLYKRYDAEKYEEQTLPGANIRNHVITDLEPGTHYSIRMQSFNMAGRSGFSNLVVESTKSRPESPPISNEFPSVHEEPQLIDPTDTPTSGRHSNNDSLEQPVILGIVLGALLLALGVLISMCWWKQHQQKRRNLSSESQKFQDQSQCIYSDAIPPQHTKPNGGSLYPHMGNGHGPPQPHDPRDVGRNGMNIDVNPLAEYDLQTVVHPADGRGKQYYGNGIGSENVGRYRDSGEMMYMEDSLQQQSGMAPQSIQHRTLPSTPSSPLSSFYKGNGSSQSHEYSEPAEREFPKSPSGISHSHPHQQNMPIINSQGIPHSSSASYRHAGHHPSLPPHHQNHLGHPRGYPYDWSGSYEHAHGGANDNIPQMGRHTPLNFRPVVGGCGGGGQDFESSNPLLMHPHPHPQSQQPLRYPVQQHPVQQQQHQQPPPPFHSTGGSSSGSSRAGPPPPPMYYKTVPVDYPQGQGQGQTQTGGRLQQAPAGRHKKRKKRQNGGARDHPPYYKEAAGVRDQATNTDLSSNEGTIEFTSFGKSGSSSNSVSNYGSEDNGCVGVPAVTNIMAHTHNRDSSFANNGSLESVDNESVSVASGTSNDYDMRTPVDYSLPL